MSSAALAALLALTPGALEITGDATCPAPTEVARRLAELLPTTAEAPRPEESAGRVVVARNGLALRLVLLGPNANELATRELPTDGTCDDLATAAAVVVAAWQADLNPDLTPAVGLPSKPAAPTPAVAAPTIARAAPTTPAPPTRLELGLGLIVSDVAGDLAPGAILTGALGRGDLGLVAGLMDTTSRTTAVGALANVASWTRVTLSIGPAWQPRRGGLRADVRVQGLVGVLHVRGMALANAASDTTPQLGAGAGGTLALLTGTSSIWLGFDVLAWPGNQRLIIQNDAQDQGRLSQLELVASLGLSMGRFP
jgi:hypothetical protein